MRDWKPPSVCRDAVDQTFRRDIHGRQYTRCNDVSIANRMRKAGFDEVISPSIISGSRVAELILDGQMSQTAAAN